MLKRPCHLDENGSFSPVRLHSRAQYFVDGHDTYRAISHAIEFARNEVSIEDIAVCFGVILSFRYLLLDGTSPPRCFYDAMRMPQSGLSSCSCQQLNAGSRCSFWSGTKQKLLLNSKTGQVDVG